MERSRRHRDDVIFIAVVIVILSDSARVWLKLALARRAGAPTESVAA